METTISNQDLLYVLRNGIEDMGCKLKVCFFKPESDLNPIDAERYEANILGCTRQFRYTMANTNTIDMVLSVNGIPVVALELKNQLTGQDYVCAINQFKHDRSSKEFAFRLNHRFLVYFAVDLYEAYSGVRLALLFDNKYSYLTLVPSFMYADDAVLTREEKKQFADWFNARVNNGRPNQNANEYIRKWVRKVIGNKRFSANYPLGSTTNFTFWIVENELEQFWTVFKTALYDRIFE